MDYSEFRGLEFSRPEETVTAREVLFKKHLDHARRSPYYQRTLKGLDIENITIGHLRDLPFTEKSAFEDHNDELLAVPLSDIRDIVLSSGTTGRPTRVMYTEHDLVRLAYNEEISFQGCGITPEDITLLTCTIDRCFVAGLAYYLGMRAVGASVIRNGLSSFASHTEIIQRMAPTVIVGVPSFLHKLAEFLKTRGIDPGATGVRKLICIGEPLRDRDMNLLKMGQYLEEEWNARAYSTYASSETITTFCECSAQKGGHLHPELAIVEIVNEQGEPQPDGIAGEVVVTPLAVEGMPLLRFKTGDVSYLINEPCECGRYSPRLGPILGRKKQMIKYRGTTLYPQAVYAVLDGIPQISEYYVTVSSDFDLSDILKVHVSMSDRSFGPEDIRERLQARLRVRPDVIIEGEDEIRKTILSGNSRKINRFIDRRHSK